VSDSSYLKGEGRTTGYAPTADEISLVDLGVHLLRRWRLILAVFICTVLIGMVAVALNPPKFRYTATVQLGGYTGSDGKIVHSLSPAAAKARLENGIIDKAIRSYVSGKSDLSASSFRISVRSPQKSNLILLEAKGPAHLSKAYLTIERDVVETLASESSDQIRNYRANLEASLAKARFSLDKLQDPQEIAAKKTDLQEKLSRAKAELAKLEQRESLLRKKRKYLHKTANLYRKLAGHLNGYIAQAQSDGLSSSHSLTPTQAMTAMLLNNQVQQNMQRLVSVEQKLTSQLPQQVAELQTQLADLGQKQAIQKIAIKRAELRLQNYAAQNQRQIQAQKIVVKNLETRLSNARETRLVAGPVQSLKPVGTPGSLIIALSAIIGMFLGLFAALLAGFLSAVKKAWREQGVPRSLSYVSDKSPARHEAA